MKNHYSVLPTLLLASAVFVSNAGAAILASENFGTNPNQDLLGGNGVGWAANWTNQTGTGQYFNNAGLFGVPSNVFNHETDTYGYVGAGNERTGRNLDTTLAGNFGTNGYINAAGDIGQDGTTLYMGMAIRGHRTDMTGDINPGGYYGLEFHRDGDGDANRIFQLSGDGGGGSGLALRENNNNATFSFNYNQNVQYWVFKFNFGVADADSVDFFYDPTLNAAEGTPTTSRAGTNLSFDRISLANFGGNFVDFDDIRLGTTYADVVGAVPEPSSALLPVCAAAACLVRRRRSA